MTFAIETTDLRYRNGRSFEIAGLQMRVPTGAVYGFLGPNGAGKTTTVRLLLGLTRPDAGTIAVLGRAMPEEYVAVLAKTGFVPERPHLYPTLTVDETMRLHASVHRGWSSARAADLRKRFDLPTHQHVGALSKGETGKLMMLLALAQQPELLVLDEPTDGLDPVVRRDVLEALLDFVSGQQATVVISSHLVHELERICDWIAVMDRGSLVAELPTQQFKNGIKRLHVTAPPAVVDSAPFVVVLRRPRDGGGEEWLVRGWSPEMTTYLEARGAVVRDVVDLDLEESFVELLRSSRQQAA
jgi:ABC-2 type transport system ATP-binding protein